MKLYELLMLAAENPLSPEFNNYTSFIQLYKPVTLTLITSGINSEDARVLGYTVCKYKDSKPETLTKPITLDDCELTLINSSSEDITKTQEFHKVPEQVFKDTGMDLLGAVDHLEALIGVGRLLCYNKKFTTKILCNFIYGTSLMTYRIDFTDVTKLCSLVRSRQGVSLTLKPSEYSQLLSSFPSRPIKRCLEEYQISSECPAGTYPSVYMAKALFELFLKVCVEEIPTY